MLKKNLKKEKQETISQDSSKGGAVETGCSDLYGVIYYFTIQYYPNPLHPPPTAPPCNEYPRGFDSNRISSSRGGILMSIGNFRKA